MISHLAYMHSFAYLMRKKTVISVPAARAARAFFILTFLFDGKDNARKH